MTFNPLLWHVNQEGHGCKPLIHAHNAPHSGVMGEGSIDARADSICFTKPRAVDLAHQAKMRTPGKTVALLVIDSSNDFTSSMALRSAIRLTSCGRQQTDGFTAGA